MPGTHVALLRGINVGRAKRVAMAELRDVFTSLGYQDVQTLLNSGNVAFTARRKLAATAAARIEEAFTKHFGFSSRIILLSSVELAEIVSGDPMEELVTDPARYLIAILKEEKDRSLLAPLLKQDWSPDALRAGNRAAYLWCPEGMLASRLADAVGRTFGDAFTVRNWATLKKLHALVERGR